LRFYCIISIHPSIRPTLSLPSSHFFYSVSCIFFTTTDFIRDLHECVPMYYFV
jgi:hypothetical protein